MKVAVSATGGSMQARVSEQFGRCAYIVVVETETMKFVPVSNEAQGLSGGAGPEAIRQIEKSGAKTLLTGRLGPNAEKAAQAVGITVVLGLSGEWTVAEAVERFLRGEIGSGAPAAPAAAKKEENP